VVLETRGSLTKTQGMRIVLGACENTPFCNNKLCVEKQQAPKEVSRSTVKLERL
jgi:hypothetical protein